MGESKDNTVGDVGNNSNVNQGKDQINIGSIYKIFFMPFTDKKRHKGSENVRAVIPADTVLSRYGSPVFGLTAFALISRIPYPRFDPSFKFQIIYIFLLYFGLPMLLTAISYFIANKYLGDDIYLYDDRLEYKNKTYSFNRVVLSCYRNGRIKVIEGKEKFFIYCKDIDDVYTVDKLWKGWNNAG